LQYLNDSKQYFMKHITTKFFALVVLSVVLFTACKKVDEDKLNDGDDLQEMSTDASVYFQETEQIFNDISNAMEGSSLGKTGTIDGANINDSTFIAFKRVVITYTGPNLSGTRTRTGTATLQLTEGAKWSDAGAVLKIDFNNVRVTNNVNGNTITVNGTYYARNVNGGKAFSDAQVVHKVWGNGSTTFGSGETNAWFLNRERTFTNNSGVLTISTRGDTTIAGKQNVIIWGTNRKGKPFWIQTDAAILLSSQCFGKVMSGRQLFSGLSAEFSVTHGVKADGTPNDTGCPFGYKVEWKNQKGENKSAVISY